ncbi:hypothetical protein HI914_06869 [Erysiphe necator]|uniref:Putative lea domain-containing protein n=1 Tax=Uncinula necator TaxID=52586 RepID=A0A0B1P1W7_UNCNE|nr:hypothetical protein HI914_06869 [Erysiphe necator]KHJ32652.1 putative lea domain-containing protein [Erysiphe necator]
MLLLSRKLTTQLLKIGKILPRASASFSTSCPRGKTVIESVKKQVKETDQAIADKIVDGINASQSIAGKAKEITGLSGKEAKGKVEEKAEDLKDEAKNKKEEIKKKL